MIAAVDAPLDAPLSEAEFQRLAALSRRLPLRCISSVRRRRLLFLALCSPGFVAVFATPLHRSLFVLAAGFAAFGAAVAFRGRTERVFVRAEAAELWPPPPPPFQERCHV